MNINISDAIKYIGVDDKDIDVYKRQHNCRSLMENDFKNTIYKNKLIGYVGFMGESVKKRKAKQATVQNRCV